MTQKSSRLILESAIMIEKAINKWFELLVKEAVYKYEHDQNVSSAKFLFVNNNTGEFFVHVIEGLEVNDKCYWELIKCNYTLNFPIIAASVAIPLIQDFSNGRVDKCLFITKETALLSKRQIWIEIENKETNKKSLYLDQYLSTNAAFPEHIKRFNKVIHSRVTNSYN